MPSEAAHRRAAAVNEALANQLVASHPDWAIVVTFYSSLHLVDTFLARSAIHPGSHTERERFIAVTQLRPIYAAYRLLSRRSREARYDLKAFTSLEATGLLNGEFEAIKAHLRGLLGALA
jgi:hypothetical protein